jgi:hypothetical protein
MTPDEVLEQFKACHQISCEWGWSDGNDKITHDMSVLDWQIALDLKKVTKLGKDFNQFYDTDITQEEWLKVFTPGKKKKLRGVCELIASKAKISKLKPYTILGKSCLSAGTFLTLTELLKNNGVDISSIAPSTQLSGYLQPIKRRVPLLEILLKFEPKVINKYKVEHRSNSFRIYLGLLSILVFVVSFVLLLLNQTKAGEVGFLLFILLIGIIIIHAKLDKRDYSSIQSFDNIETFRDLSVAIVKIRGST